MKGSAPVVRVSNLVPAIEGLMGVRLKRRNPVHQGLVEAVAYMCSLFGAAVPYRFDGGPRSDEAVHEFLNMSRKGEPAELPPEVANLIRGADPETVIAEALLLHLRSLNPGASPRILAEALKGVFPPVAVERAYRRLEEQSCF